MMALFLNIIYILRKHENSSCKMRIINSKTQNSEKELNHDV